MKPRHLKDDLIFCFVGAIVTGIAIWFNPMIAVTIAGAIIGLLILSLFVT